MHWSMEDEEGSGQRSPVTVMAAVKTEISTWAMAAGTSIVDNRQRESARERWGGLVGMESRGTKDCVKGAVCGVLLTEAKERAKQGGQKWGLARQALRRCRRPKPPDGCRQVTRESGGPEPLSVGPATRTRLEVGVRWACHLTYT
jgi:hypothetical protein